MRVAAVRVAAVRVGEGIAGGVGFGFEGAAIEEKINAPAIMVMKPSVSTSTRSSYWNQPGLGNPPHLHAIAWLVCGGAWREWWQRVAGGVAARG